MAVPGIFLPREERGPGGLIRPQPVVANVRLPAEIADSLAVSGLVLPPEKPSLQRQVFAYAVHTDFIPYLEDSDAAAWIEHTQWTTADVIESVKSVPFESGMTWAASIQRSLWSHRIDAEWQARLLHDVYGVNSILAVAGQKLLEASVGLAAFSEQQLFALQRLITLHAVDAEPAQDISQPQLAELRKALWLIPGTVLSDELEPETVEVMPVDDERWLRLFIANGGLSTGGSFKHDLARTHRIFHVIANSAWARNHPDYCPIDEWLIEQYAMTYCELQALGIALFAGARVGLTSEPPLAVPEAYFDSTALKGRVRSGWKALAADRRWYRAQFMTNEDSPRRAAWDVHPFLQRPALQLSDGRLVVLSPRAIETWLGSAGSYYRLVDLARETVSDSERRRFQRFHGHLFERYVRHIAHVAHPGPRTSGLLQVAGRVLAPIEYRVKRQTFESSDVVIDLGTDLVLVEVVAKRLTQASMVDADVVAIRRDLGHLIVEKAKQLRRVMADIESGALDLPGTDVRFVERAWPIVVIPEGILQTPTLWSLIDNELEPELSAGVEHLDVRPLTILDIEEFELLMGFVQADPRLVAYLSAKTEDVWARRDFKAWLVEAQHRFATPEPAFINQEFGRLFRTTARVLQIGGSR